MHFEAYRAWAKYLGLSDQSARGIKEEWLMGALASNCCKIISSATTKLPRFDMGYVFLGRMHLDEGDEAKARTFFQRAIKLNPDNAQADRYLTRLDKPATPSDKSGVMKRISGWFGSAKKEEVVKPVRIKNITRRKF